MSGKLVYHRQRFFEEKRTWDIVDKISVGDLLAQTVLPAAERSETYRDLTKLDIAHEAGGPIQSLTDAIPWLESYHGRVKVLVLRKKAVERRLIP